MENVSVAIRRLPTSDASETNNVLSSIDLSKYFSADNETPKNEVNTSVHNSSRPYKQKGISKSSDAYKEFKSLDRYGQIDFKTKRISCKLCDKTWTWDRLGNSGNSRHGLRVHVDSVHMEKYLSCRFCRKEYFSVVTFMKQNNSRSGHGNSRCDECGIKDLCRAGFSYHKNLKHKKEAKSYKCKDCDYVCRRKDYLTRHELSIHENVRFPCDQCEYQATRKQYLESHIKKIHEKEDPKITHAPQKSVKQNN